MINEKIEKIKKISLEIFISITKSSNLSLFLDWFYDSLNLNFNGDEKKGLSPNKGDIYIVDLGINIGSELNKRIIKEKILTKNWYCRYLYS